MYFTEVAEFMDEALKSGGKEAKSDLKMPYKWAKIRKKVQFSFFVLFFQMKRLRSKVPEQRQDRYYL